MVDKCKTSTFTVPTLADVTYIINDPAFTWTVGTFEMIDPLLSYCVFTYSSTH